ncbi:threonine synthase [Parvularcula oceani]|uniref:threonine synthase n=1 Tax=Parvularcula oceani TaxID=1247963 RepID=UPI0004E1AA6B
MNYLSTRSLEPGTSRFGEVVLRGLAADGGLYLPVQWPRLGEAQVEGLRGKPYARVAAEVLSLFADDLHGSDIRAVTAEAYEGFGHPAVAPLVQTGPDDFLLELFHGPTLAFKDVAMQLLGPLFDRLLAERDRTMTVAAATSGDTGGAAIAALSGRERVRICVLHPHERISEVQRRFMTTTGAPGVENLAVQGTFDDCQGLVKDMFADEAFRTAVSLGAVNSINWARIVAQSVYYLTSSLALGQAGRPMSYCVPTGNFGDVFAGYVAKRMGAPIGRLIVATNDNDILDRALRTGRHEPRAVQATHSPSMDIQVSSNFERLLFEASGRDAELVTRLMTAQRAGEAFGLPESVRARISEEFSSYRAGSEEVADRMRRAFEETAMLIDPHTAVGLVAADKARAEGLEGPLVTLATAHPAKFPGAVEAATGRIPALPPHAEGLMAAEERFEVVPPRLEAVQRAVQRLAGA